MKNCPNCGASLEPYIRKAIYDLTAEEIIYCEDCKYYCNILYQGTQFEYGECDAFDEFYIKDKKPHDFCSMARLKDEDGRLC